MSAVAVPRPIVEEAVSAAFGTGVKVIRHNTKTLTAPGDNFATTVVCLQVELETSPDTADNSSESVQSKVDNGTVRDIQTERKVPLDVDASCYGKKEPSDPSVSIRANEHINSHRTEDFVSKSDNGTDRINQRCANNSSSTKTWTCIAKTNSKKESVFFKIFSKFAFENEIRFYKTILSALNKELSKSNASSLKVSNYYYSNKEENHELIIMEDLRRSGFTMGNKSRGLDSHRCMEVVKELARMHSASVLVRRNNSKQEKAPSGIIQTDKLNGDATQNKDDKTRCDAFDFISGESYLVKDGPIMNIFVGLVQTRITSALDLFSKIEGTEKEVAWLKSVETDIPTFLRKMLVECEPEFLVLCHGDTWTNNFLFSPNLDVVSIVDFQIIRPASLATDLNYLFYTSHCGYFTPIHLDTILDAYYAEFATILGAQGHQMPFTRKALSAEVEAKKPWGVMGGVLTLPLIFPQQQGGNGSTSSIKEAAEKDTKSESRADENDAEENSKDSMAGKATWSIINEAEVEQSSDSGVNKETSTGDNSHQSSVAGLTEVPCNTTFEEKFLELLKNITL